MTLIDNVDDYLYLKESENGNLKFEVDAHQLDLKLHHFSQFPLNVKKKKKIKLAGLWLAGEVVNHVGIYGSKAAEGLSAFQRRSCSFWYCIFIKNVGFIKLPESFHLFTQRLCDIM